MSLFNNTTIDGIVSSLKKNVTDLEKLRSTKLDLAADKGSQIAKLAEEQDSLRAEAVRAEKIANNFKRLIGEL